MEEFYDAPAELAAVSGLGAQLFRCADSVGVAGRASATDAGLSLDELRASAFKHDPLGSAPALFAWLSHLRRAVGAEPRGEPAVDAPTRASAARAELARRVQLIQMSRAAREEARQLELRRASFRLIADADERLDFAAFSRAVRGALQQETLTDAVLQRVFAQLDHGSGRISHADFEYGLGRWHLLKSIISSYAPSATTKRFCVPASYDYSKPTSANYAADASEGYEPENGPARVLRDYGYHARYSRARQRWQDAVLRGVVTRTDAQPRPWLVFTCGPTGAGKGYALSWMSERGHFPLEAIVHVDPDHFKRLMPEWEGYAARDGASAGSLTHHESCFLQELATECAMRGSQHVWCDGSLRDGEWLTRVLDDVRARYPAYRVAIFHVYASEDVVRQRCAERAERTGRAVPEQLLCETLRSPEQTLRRVTHKVDFVARICNDDVPRLEVILSVDRSSQWSALSAHFSHELVTRAHFPDALPPLALASTCVVHADLDARTLRALHRPPADGAPGDRATVEVSLAVGAPLLQRAPDVARLAAALRVEPSELAVELSRLHPVNLDDEARALADVPPNAYTVAFAYPCERLTRAQPDVRALGACGVALGCAEVQLLLHGGFVYFDLDEQVARVSAITREPSRHMLQFGAPEQLDGARSDALAGRWRPVAWGLDLLRGDACLSYCWVCPGERLADRRVAQHGALAFSFARHDDAGGARSRGAAARRLGVPEELLGDRLFPVLGRWSTRTLPPAASISRPTPEPSIAAPSSVPPSPRSSDGDAAAEPDAATPAIDATVCRVTVDHATGVE
ncbi:hypothetical protein KFE25_011528 [Diacronema lutheri]|uniref:Zeta toxin domain-containing protein n=3 Tax=Diacronema lutheri TaxID=2081491 RepID=A0A8J5X909_DIALT|nr:hypothetical protein KFE25_011528 [Diacronema lutheri]